MTNRTMQTATGFFVFACLVVSVSGARAQTSGTTGTTGTSGSVSQKVQVVPVSGGANATAAAPAQTSAEQLTAANDIIARGSKLSGRVAQLLDEARRDADMIRVTCLNDKLAQVNANLNTAQSRLTAFQKAANGEQRNHEYTVLSVLGQKFQELEQGANACVGQDLYDTGPTKVTTEIETSTQPFENNPGSPPTTLPPITIIVPPDASPME
jgi:hypothetical protein